MLATMVYYADVLHPRLCARRPAGPDRQANSSARRSIHRKYRKLFLGRTVMTNGAFCGPLRTEFEESLVRIFFFSFKSIRFDVTNQPTSAATGPDPAAGRTAPPLYRNKEDDPGTPSPTDPAAVSYAWAAMSRKTLASRRFEFYGTNRLSSKGHRAGGHASIDIVLRCSNTGSAWSSAMPRDVFIRVRTCSAKPLRTRLS